MGGCRCSATSPGGALPLGHTASEDWIQACPPWMGRVPGGRGSSCQPGVASPCPGHLPAQPATLTCRTTPMTGRFRVCPGTGAGHWSISLHTVVRGGHGQEPALWKRPAKATGSHSWTMRLSGCPNGHSPASRQGASLSKYSGAIRLSSAWNSRVKGRRDTSTRDCRPTARRCHPASQESAGPWAHRESPRALRSTSSTGQLSQDGPTRTPGLLAGKTKPSPDREGNPDNTWVGPRFLWGLELKAEVQVLILRVRSRGVWGPGAVLGEGGAAAPSPPACCPGAPALSASQWGHLGPRGSPSGSSPSSRSCPSPAGSTRSRSSVRTPSARSSQPRGATPHAAPAHPDPEHSAGAAPRSPWSWGQACASSAKKGGSTPRGPSVQTRGTAGLLHISHTLPLTCAQGELRGGRGWPAPSCPTGPGTWEGSRASMSQACGKQRPERQPAHLQ